MANQPPKERNGEAKPPRRALRGWRGRALGALALAVLAVSAGLLALAAARSPVIPPEWNPFAPLTLAEPATPMTAVKLWRAGREPAYCRAALADEPGAERAADREESEGCHIRNAVELTALSGAAMAPMLTTCETALRLAFWARRGVQPAAEATYGAPVARIVHFQSYSCRPVRTTRGGSGRMSEHATANAADIAAFVLADGRRVDVADWPDEAGFLRAVRDAGCDWFRAVLGPEHDALHADHLHFDQGRWPVCR